MTNGGRLTKLTTEEKLALGGTLIVAAFVPWLLGLAGAGFIGWALLTEYEKGKHSGP